MNAHDQYLEQIWADLLSREEGSIRQAYLSLDEPSRHVVFQHLHKMTLEDGWHPEQVKSARKALEIIYKIKSE